MLDTESYIYSKPANVDIDLSESQFKKYLYYLEMTKTKNAYLRNYAINKLTTLKHLSGNQRVKLCFIHKGHSS